MSLHKRIRWIQLVVIAIFFAVAIYLVPQPPAQPLSFSKEPGKMFNTYLFPDIGDSQPQLPFIVSKILGTTLNMDWYDVCLINTSLLEQGTTTLPSAPIAIELFPIRSNMTLSDLEAWANNFLSANTINSNTHPVFASMLIANPNTPTCIRALPSDYGFLYAGPSVVVPGTQFKVGMTFYNEPSSTFWIPLGIGDERFALGNSMIYVSANKYALWIKRFTLFFAFFGLYLLIRQIAFLIVKQKKTGE